MGIVVLPSRSLKLLPILGVPSLASLPEPTDRRGLERACSAVRRGLRGLAAWPVRRVFSVGRLTGTPELAELAEDSVVTGCREVCRCSAGRHRRASGLSALRRRVALRSCPLPRRDFCPLPRDIGRKAGDSSSSSSSSSLRPGLWIENLPNRLNLGFFRLSISSSSDSDSDELDVRYSSSSKVGDLRTAAGGTCSRLVMEGRRP